jgi:hypothetical protein
MFTLIIRLFCIIISIFSYIICKYPKFFGIFNKNKKI